MNIAQAKAFFDQLELSPEESAVAARVLEEIRQRLKFLNDVGLDYLTLDRLSSTLSGGEAQRIQLATCLGSRLVGACYVLDEPSIGLHSRDTERLIRILYELRDLGNTVIVVEHDADIMRAADYIVDLGPGAGERGGRVVFAGPYRELISNGTQSLTAAYLRGERRVSPARVRRRVKPERVIKFYGAAVHNLKNIDVAIPLDMIVAITGVSGSGKSTLVYEVIYRALEALHKASPLEDNGDRTDVPVRLPCRRVEGAELIRQAIMVDQSPIGRTPRSNPVTYVKAFDIIRELFASTPEAQRRGYTPGHFSFNVPGGRCEACQGDGVVTVEMQFLADVELVCEECKGTRYKSAILEVRYRGLNIHEGAPAHRRRGPAFLRRSASAGLAAQGPLRGGPGLSQAGPVGHHALGRRGPARQAGGPSGAGDLPGYPVHLRRTYHRSALRRHRAPAQRLSAAGG
jgi:excinuclease ABC subunit A